jgi:hypothetical protein
VRKHLGQVRAGIADPAPFAGDAQQLLGYRQARQLGVGQCWLAAGPVLTRPAQRRQRAVVEMNVECGQEGVQVVRHKMILDALRHAFRAPTRAKI